MIDYYQTESMQLAVAESLRTAVPRIPGMEGVEVQFIERYRHLNGMFGELLTFLFVGSGDQFVHIQVGRPFFNTDIVSFEVQCSSVPSADDNSGRTLHRIYYVDASPGRPSDWIDLATSMDDWGSDADYFGVGSSWCPCTVNYGPHAESNIAAFLEFFAYRGKLCRLDLQCGQRTNAETVFPLGKLCRNLHTHNDFHISIELSDHDGRREMSENCAALICHVIRTKPNVSSVTLRSFYGLESKAPMRHILDACKEANLEKLALYDCNADIDDLDIVLRRSRSQSTSLKCIIVSLDSLNDSSIHTLNNVLDCLTSNNSVSDLIIQTDPEYPDFFWGAARLDTDFKISKMLCNDASVEDVISGSNHYLQMVEVCDSLSHTMDWPERSISEYTLLSSQSLYTDISLSNVLENALQQNREPNDTCPEFSELLRYNRSESLTDRILYKLAMCLSRPPFQIVNINSPYPTESFHTNNQMDEVPNGESLPEFKLNYICGYCRARPASSPGYIFGDFCDSVCDNCHALLRCFRRWSNCYMLGDMGLTGKPSFNDLISAVRYPLPRTTAASEIKFGVPMKALPDLLSFIPQKNQSTATVEPSFKVNAPEETCARLSFMFEVLRIREDWPMFCNQRSKLDAPSDRIRTEERYPTFLQDLNVISPTAPASRSPRSNRVFVTVRYSSGRRMRPVVFRFTMLQRDPLKKIYRAMRVYAGLRNLLLVYKNRIVTPDIAIGELLSQAPRLRAIQMM